jgi:hypothetical protein
LYNTRKAFDKPSIKVRKPKKPLHVFYCGWSFLIKNALNF